MENHIEVVKRALEFKKPSYLPMEILDVPGIYNNNSTLDPDTVEFVPGTENFDAMWTNSYSWFHEKIDETPEGEEIRKDQFGTIIKIPNNLNYTYDLVKNALSGKDSLKGYSFPNPSDAEPQFKKLGSVIRERYNDRFIDGFIDPGIFLTTQTLLGNENFFIKFADDLKFVIEV